MGLLGGVCAWDGMGVCVCVVCEMAVEGRGCGWRGRGG
jgi:hypothetical protein